MLLNPFAPHITEELWEQCGYKGMVTENAWPKYDESKCVDESIEIAVQVNGKVRARMTVAADITADAAIAEAKKQQACAALIEGKQIVKELYVPGRLVNLVVK